jgi:hypothetical protein
MRDKTQPRKILRAAIAERDERKRRVEVATATLTRANDLLREADDRLAEFADVEGAIISHRVDKIKDWAGSNGKKPRMDLPENLIACRKSRDEASENVTAAQFACEALINDLDEAKAVLADAERSAREAALSVMFEEAGRIAERLDAAKREMWRLSATLHGLSQIWLPTGTDRTQRPVPLSPQVLAALAAEEPQTPPNQRPEAQAEAAWRSFHTALLADPEVTFEGASFVA